MVDGREWNSTWERYLDWMQKTIENRRDSIKKKKKKR